ncbi:MAG: hydroxyacylglutathione hydrolase [Azospirillum sp.]|nr:hydroxyacylglutathione hydrolase [Azospirillum sp.]
MEIELIPALRDNYIYLLHDPGSGAVGVVDPAEATPVLAALERRGWALTHIFNTHHHADHIGGDRVLKQRFGCPVIGAVADRHRIPELDLALGDGDLCEFGSLTAAVIEVPGHTCGHIAFYFAGAQVLFCGDTLFSLGCGRLFEGTPTQMWGSLLKLRALPEATRVYCGHEYTEANLRFAVTVDPDNPALGQRAAEIMDLRRRNLPTIPSTLGVERATNPFLRADHPALRQAAGLKINDPVAVFAELRRRKDVF